MLEYKFISILIFVFNELINFFSILFKQETRLLSQNRFIMKNQLTLFRKSYQIDSFYYN